MIDNYKLYMDDGNSGSFTLYDGAIPSTTLDYTITYASSATGSTYRFYMIAINVNG